MPETINCPHCGESIELDKVLIKKLEANLSQEYKLKLGNALKKATEEKEKELESLQAKLDQANSNELALRKQKNELEQRAKEVDLEVQRKVDGALAEIQNAAFRSADEQHRAKDLEKDKKIADALAQIEDMRRKMEQGSQQAQGEVLELQLEEALKAEYPLDLIEPVAKGVKGGDLIQTVRSKTGEEAGKILWELKRTKAFSEGWLAKMKADGRAAKCSVLLLATETMPAGLEAFGMVDGVWVSSLQNCIPLSRSLRFGMTQVARERMMQSGRKEKAEILYDYLIGDEFRARVEALVETYKGMKEGLDAERIAMERIWAKRQKQIEQVVFNLAGMHGEFQALAGDSLPNVKLLEIN